jgi:hypothetical protein
MGWTVIIEDENGNAKKTMPAQFALSNEEIIGNDRFLLLKYLDPYGDTTFNSLMFEDLIRDLTKLKELLPGDREQIDTVMNYAKECNEGVHVYLKFYGD